MTRVLLAVVAWSQALIGCTARNDDGDDDDGGGGRGIDRLLVGALIATV